MQDVNRLEKQEKILGKNRANKSKISTLRLECKIKEAEIETLINKFENLKI